MNFPIDITDRNAAASSNAAAKSFLFRGLIVL
jgi:hypothetical protein